MDKKTSYIDFLYENAEVFSKQNENFLFSTDKDIISQKYCVNSKERVLQKNEKTKLHINLLPQPVIGNIKNGKIFICSLNPGFDDCNYEDEENCLKNYILKQLRQDEDSTMFWLEKTNEIKSTAGAKWWIKKLDQGNQAFSLVNNIAIRYRKEGIYTNITPEEAKDKVFEMLSQIIVELELFPYHSKTMNKSLLKKCLKEENKNSSVHKMYDFVHEKLIPNLREDQIVCFTRSIGEWCVTEEEKNNKAVFYNDKNYCQKITFNFQLPLGEFIFNHIKEITSDFKQVYDFEKHSFVMPNK